MTMTPRKSRADLLRAIARGELGLEKSVPPIRRRKFDTAPLSYSQARLWFLDQLDPENSTYSIPSAWRLIGSLDRAAFEATHRRSSDGMKCCGPYFR